MDLLEHVCVIERSMYVGKHSCVLHCHVQFTLGCCLDSDGSGYTLLVVI